MTQQVCPCCGQSLPDDSPAGVYLAPTQEQIFRHVQRAGRYGIDAERLFFLLYGHRADGGPQSGAKLVHVQVHLTNRRLAQVGKVIQAPRSGRGVRSHYVLRDL